ncbi:MAG: hypothetical protein ACREFE_12960 [Limisphaerales bacterium]
MNGGYRSMKMCFCYPYQGRRLLARFPLIAAIILLTCATAVSNTTDTAFVSRTTLTNILNNPISADGSVYDAKDSQGNEITCAKVIDLTGQTAKYAAVYYSPYAVSGGYRYKVNLATSSDLIHWQFVRTLVDNADMPDIKQVTNGSWLILTHEQWINGGTDGPSTAPCQVAFELFYDTTDLLNGTIRASWLAPSYVSDLNGTPNIYEADLVLYTNYWAADLVVGFHYWAGTNDENAYAAVHKFALPLGGTFWDPTNALVYNEDFANAGVNDLGLRDNFTISSGTYNVQEGNLGTPGGTWDEWRVFLYTYEDTNIWPTGNGTVLQLSPQTPNGSFSFGAPCVSVIKSPTDNGNAMFVSYFIFTQGAGTGEAGDLIYYYNLSLPVLVTKISADTLTLSWPSDYASWHLEVQTNSLGTNWVTIPNIGGSNSYTNIINSTKETVFYRLAYP